jgi:CubicO group peptidase (beta-lactamase class C family)
MKKISLISPIWLFILVFSYISCKGQSVTKSNPSKSFNQTKVDKINTLIGKYAEYGEFNGAVLVAEAGKVIYKKGVGLANMEEQIPNEASTKFRLASITKQFTAMLIMQLVAEDKLALDSSISTYLPNFPKEKGAKITIHHLLTHSSGIPNYTSFPDYQEIMKRALKPTELIDLFKDAPLQFKPGERFSYSNSGYVLLGQIIEEITGKSYQKVLQEKILKPLKMDNSGLEDSKKLLKNQAAGYNKKVDRFDNASYIDMSVAYSAGGMYSTVEDLFLWDQALYTEKLLPQKHINQLFAKHIPAWRRHYGYGWMMGEKRIGNTNDYIQVIEHDGVINGFNTLILRIPSSRSSIILLNNTGGAPLHPLSEAINGILNNQPYDLPKKSVAHSLFKKIKAEGLNKGLTFYESVKDVKEYILHEHEMNLMGYELLALDKKKAALAVFKLNVEAFPNSSNVYDSYGEALMKLGDKSAAIKNYKKSIKLNPRNENGIKMLEQLGVKINKADLYLLKTAPTWGKEIFTFPLNFAQEIDYKGIEEAHFPKGWRKTAHIEFWSYVFAWQVNLDKELTVSQLEKDMQFYFDGLMERVNKKKNKVLPKTVAKMKREQHGDGQTNFSGTLQIYDAFVTEKEMHLNVLVEQHYCKQKKESIIFFRFSPKEFESEIWQILNKITLREHKCED